MKLPLLACTLCLGLVTPIVAGSIVPATANPSISPSQIAIDKYPDGTYIDRDWNVYLYRSGGTYHYRGTNNLTKATIEFSGANISGTKSRRIYTWNNGGTRYRVTWKVSDPDTIRLQVIAPNGKEQLNRLLTYEGGC
jgi:hypothetical protein